MTSDFPSALKRFESLAFRYIDYGALDTEPRYVFSALIAKVVNDGVIPTPPSDADGWQLYSSMDGADEAARELAEAADRAITAAAHDTIHAIRFVRGGGL